ncbi:MAG: FtsX-like permease family protein [Chryseolinea sp.]
MIRNYLKVALRSILRNKLSAFINIFGLALAMSCSLLIYLFIRDEVSYDKYNDNADRMYRVTRNFLSPDGSVNLHLGHCAPPFGPLLKNDFGEFEEVGRTLNWTVLVARKENGNEQKSFNEEHAYFAEPEILKIFTIPVVESNVKKNLEDPFHVMLSEKTAKRYFGSEDPIGKTLRMGNNYDITVSGIFKDLPAQSLWHPDLLLSFSTLNDTTIYGRSGLERNWGNNSFGTFVLAKTPLNIPAVEKKFPAFVDKHVNAGEGDGTGPKPSTWTTLFLQKVTDIHLNSHLDSEEEANGNMNNVYMMGVIALFIVLIACFNFVNLSTARASKRAKEVGMRKVVGAVKAQLINQYLSESILIAMFALIISIGFSYLAIGWLNAFTGKSITIDLVNHWNLVLAMVVFAITIGILAGIYPAFVISGFKPVLILKGQQGSKGKGLLRKSLVVAQFAVSIVLIISTIITLRQLNYLNDRQLGYNKDQVVTLSFPSEIADNYDAFYNELTKASAIKNVSRSSRVPTGRLLDSQGTGRIQKGDSLSDTNVVLKNIHVDEEFFNTYEISFASGRNFSKNIPTDDSLAFILNESAVKMMGMTNDNIVDKEFQYAGVKGRVVGVVKDFHFESLHEPIVPIVFENSGNLQRLSVKLSGANVQDGIASIEKVWKDFIPYLPFEYSFLSMQYKNLYESEQKQSQLFVIFAGLAILIACLGLFGLATFNAMQRVKEIGIRKVLGASVPSILKLLSREIVILIIIANIIAWPIAWYFMNEWLNTFAYHVSMSLVTYILAGAVAVLIALITVSTQTIRAALGNPANTLRYE